MGRIMSMVTSPPEAPARKLRWFQYSLQSLLLLTLAVSLGMSWVAVRMKRAREQREAVEEIVKLGGRATYDYQVQESGNSLPDAEPCGPAWLRSILGETFFARVVDAAFPPPVTDADLAHLEGLTQLQSLYVFETKVTEDGVTRLQKALPGCRIGRSPPARHTRCASPRSGVPANGGP
jgi:hypothetical protein